MEFGDGTIRLRLPFREELVSDPDVPYLHGGIVATLLDCAADYAIATRIGQTLPTIDMRVDFLRVAGREPIDGIGMVLKIGRTVAVTDARIENASGQVLALGRILFSSATAA